MKFKKLVCMLMFTVILFSGTAVHAGTQGINSQNLVCSGEYAPDETVTFIVEVEGDPSLVSEQARAAGAQKYIKTAEAKKAEAQILKKQMNVLEDIERRVQTDVKKGYTYTALFNGFSMEGRMKDREAIQSLPGVKNVYVSKKRYLEKPYMASAGEMTDVPEAVDAFGLKGEGQVVAVIDTEFDTAHEFFSEPVENPKYTKADIAEILNEETMNVSVSANRVYRNSKIPFAFDYACNTADTFNDTPAVVHGTHVAGITAGKNGTGPEGAPVSGVAPEAQMILMKITDETGLLIDAAILAALDDAAKFGVSAVNLSLGTDYLSASSDMQYQSVLNAARNAGIFISAAAGNASRGFKKAVPSVENIDYAAGGTPNGFSDATAVASVDNLFQYNKTGKLIFSDGQEVLYNHTSDGSAFAKVFAGTEQEYVYCGLGKTEDFEGLNLSGKIALVKRGEITFVDKADNAKAAGAAGIILWNNETGMIQTDELSLPGAWVTSEAGEVLGQAEQKIVTITDVSMVKSEVENGGKPSSFTSWGTGENLELKPEIAAPGGHIYSSVPNDKYQAMGGTSMAAPHITGLVALMNQFYEDAPFSQKYNNLEGDEKVSLFENLLMSSAAVLRDEGGVAYSPRQQGAGLANIQSAISTPAILEGPDGKAKISLGADVEDRFVLHFLVKNLTEHEVTYDHPKLEVMTDDYAGTEGEYVVDDMRSLRAESDLPGRITVPAGGETEVIVQVTLDPGALAENAEIFTNGFYIDGFVTLASSGEIPALSIPFTGFHGDWRRAPIFDTTIYDEGGSTLYRPGVDTAMGTFFYSELNDGAVTALGKNLFQEEIVNRKYIAFSPNGDGIFDTLGLNIQSLRAMLSVKIEIFGEDGVCVLAEEIDANISKFHTAKLRDEKYSELSDGNYTFRLYGVYNQPGEENAYNDSFSLPFTVDTQKPAVTDVKVEQDTLTVTTVDNHFVSAIAMGYINGNGEKTVEMTAFDPLSDGEPDGVCTAKFDITGIDAESISLGVYDYAMNGNAGKLADFTDDVSVGLKDFQQVLGMTAADFTVTNRTKTEMDGVMLLAFYDKAGALVHLERRKTTLLPGEQMCSWRLTVDTEEAVEMKLFFWDELTAIQPLISAKTFSIA